MNETTKALHQTLIRAAHMAIKAWEKWLESK